MYPYMTLCLLLLTSGASITAPTLHAAHAGPPPTEEHSSEEVVEAQEDLVEEEEQDEEHKEREEEEETPKTRAMMEPKKVSLCIVVTALVLLFAKMRYGSKNPGKEQPLDWARREVEEIMKSCEKAGKRDQQVVKDAAYTVATMHNKALLLRVLVEEKGLDLNAPYQTTCKDGSIKITSLPDIAEGSRHCYLVDYIEWATASEETQSDTNDAEAERKKKRTKAEVEDVIGLSIQNLTNMSNEEITRKTGLYPHEWEQLKKSPPQPSKHTTEEDSVLV